MKRSAILVAALLAGCEPAPEAEITVDDDFEPAVSRAVTAPSGIALPLATRADATQALRDAGITVADIIAANFGDQGVLDPTRTKRRTFPPQATVTYSCAGSGNVPAHHLHRWPDLAKPGWGGVDCASLAPVFDDLTRRTGWAFVHEPDANKASIVISGHNWPCNGAHACAYYPGNWTAEASPDLRMGADDFASDIFVQYGAWCSEANWSVGADQWVSGGGDAGMKCTIFVHELGHALGFTHVTAGSRLSGDMFNNSCFAASSTRNWEVCPAYNYQIGVAAEEVLRAISGEPLPPPPVPVPLVGRAGWDGDRAVVTFNRPLTDEERAEVAACLAARWPAE